MPKHYRLSPSASKRWLACPGSLDLASKEENRPSMYSKEGSVAHDLCAVMLTLDLDEVEPPRLCNRCNSLVTSPPCQSCGSYEYRIDHDMVRHCQTYVNWIRENVLSGNVANYWIERTLESQAIADFGGTVDFYAVVSEEGAGIICHLVDFKYGMGVPVSAHDNTQMMCYALLIREAMPLLTHFRATIIQPRVSASVETVEFDQEDLDDLRVRIDRAMESGALSPGDHCKWCPAMAVCPALAEKALAAAQEAFGEMAVEDVDPQRLREIWLKLLPLKKQITDWFSAVEARVLGEMEQGQTFPGWKAVTRTGHRRWALDEAEVLERLRRRKVKKRDATETRLKSPAALEREGFGEVISDLVTRSDLGYRLVEESAPGQAVHFQPVDQMFEECQENG